MIINFHESSKITIQTSWLGKPKPATLEAGEVPSFSPTNPFCVLNNGE